MESKLLPAWHFLCLVHPFSTAGLGSDSEHPDAPDAGGAVSLNIWLWVTKEKLRGKHIMRYIT